MSWDQKLFQWHLKTRRFGREIEHFDELDSTNRWLLQNYGRFVTTGGVVVADHQTEGRGRLNRNWIDIPGKSLLFSVFIRNSLKDSSTLFLSLLPAIAIGELLRDKYAGQQLVELKWPNDVLVNGKKVAGILGQSVGGDSLVIVLGVGVNVGGQTAELPVEIRSDATSVAAESGFEPVREILLAELLNRLEPLYDQLLANETLSIRVRWLALGPPSGTRIARRESDSEVFGTFAGLGERGELLLRDENGVTRSLLSGDILYQ